MLHWDVTKILLRGKVIQQSNRFKEEEESFPSRSHFRVESCAVVSTFIREVVLPPSGIQILFSHALLHGFYQIVVLVRDMRRSLPCLPTYMLTYILSWTLIFDKTPSYTWLRTGNASPCLSRCPSLSAVSKTRACGNTWQLVQNYVYIRYKDLNCSIKSNIWLECLVLESLIKARVLPVYFPVENIL